MSTTISSAVKSHLQLVQETVGKITDPNTGQPLAVPDFDTLMAAADTLDTAANATEKMNLMQTLLGRASCVDFDVPTTINLPADHHMHPTMGVEWYWTACHLNVIDQNGNTGRLSVLMDITRNRAVGLTAQKAAGWTDEQANTANTIATVTVDMGPGKKSYYRRSQNSQWPMTGGTLSFSKPGEAFSFACGSDAVKGSEQVLPLQVIVDDGSNMQVNLTFTNQSSINTDTAYFLQGVPKMGIGETGGTGVTPAPTPGIYYSWPQLLVSGSVTVGGNTYTVEQGTGWIDHQLMMSSLENAKGATHPVPFVEDAKPFNGWVWQFYNLDNGMAFTGAGFEQGAMNYDPELVYGYFLAPDGKGGWTAIFINGNINLLSPKVYPQVCGEPNSLPVILPTVRSYSKIENAFLGKPLSGVATPWHSDGTFNFPNHTLCDEAPADYTDLSGNYSNGVGYLETVGFQSADAYRAFALAILQDKASPGTAGLKVTLPQNEKSLS